MVQAIVCLLGLGTWFLYAYLRVLSEQETSGFSMYFWWDRILFVLCLIHAALWMVADLRIGLRRWQTFFFLCAVSRVLTGLLTLSEIDRFIAAYYVPYVLVTIFLAVIVVRDHLQGIRYPWSHWLGVAIRFWFTLLHLGFLVVRTFFQHWLETGG
jgi:hypothetical protein